MLMFSESASICVVALLNFYVEVEMTHVFPGISAIKHDVLRNRWRDITDVILKCTAYWFQSM